VLELSPEEKFFYIYLLTNSKTTQCGIYELPKKIMEIETGYNRDTVTKLLRKFVDYGKIEYNEKTNEIYLINWFKYNPSKNSNIQKCVDKELESVKHRAFVTAYQGAIKGHARGCQEARKALDGSGKGNGQEAQGKAADEAADEPEPAEPERQEDDSGEGPKGNVTDFKRGLQGAGNGLTSPCQGDAEELTKGLQGVPSDSQRGYQGAYKGLARGLQGAIKSETSPYQAPTKKEEKEKEKEEFKEKEIAEAPDKSKPVDIVESVDNANPDEKEPKDAGRGPEAVPYQKIKDEWNRICTGYPPVTQVTRKRKVHMQARWKQFGKDMAMFTNAFGKLQNSLFCKGENERAWTASFDWIMGNDTNMVKVLEGKYKNKSIPAQKRPNAFHNYKQDPLPYTDKELEKMLKEINNLQ